MEGQGLFHSPPMALHFAVSEGKRCWCREAPFPASQRAVGMGVSPWDSITTMGMSISPQGSITSMGPGVSPRAASPPWVQASGSSGDGSPASSMLRSPGALAGSWQLMLGACYCCRPAPAAWSWQSLEFCASVPWLQMEEGVGASRQELGQKQCIEAMDVKCHLLPRQPLRTMHNSPRICTEQPPRTHSAPGVRQQLTLCPCQGGIFEWHLL